MLVLPGGEEKRFIPPLRSSPPSGNPRSRMWSSRRRGRGPCHSRASCDPGTAWPPDRGSDSRSNKGEKKGSCISPYAAERAHCSGAPCSCGHQSQRRTVSPSDRSRSQEGGRGDTWSGGEQHAHMWMAGSGSLNSQTRHQCQLCEVHCWCSN